MREEMNPYEAAVSMYHREHDRWHQWALFFFAGIGATLYVADQFESPRWLSSLAAAVVSFMWVLAASSIRASTDAWQATLLRLEASPDPKPGAFTTFKHQLDAYEYFDDFLKTLQFWRRKTYLSVTRLLVWSGLVPFLFFTTVAVLDGFCGCQGKP